MINNDTAKSTYTVTEGVTEYPIGFQYLWNENNQPQILVYVGPEANRYLEYGTDFTVSDDGLSVVLSAEIEAGTKLSIMSDVPFIQDSDYVIGRIDPEQIERDFDKSVLRDLQLRDYADDINDRLEDEVQARTDADAALQDAIDDEETARSLADTTLQNNIDAEADAREDADDALQAAIDGKVSKSGDTMTGALELSNGLGSDIGVEKKGNNSLKLYKKSNAEIEAIHIEFVNNYRLDVYPTMDGVMTLGGLANKLLRVYTGKINNGADIAIPALGGTMARVEDVPTQASDVHALPDTTKYGASLVLSVDPSTYVVTAQLKDQDNNNIGAAQTIDLPLESVVVSGAYDSATKEVVLTLEGGSTIRFSVADLVSGLQTEITSVNMLNADLVDDSNSAHKFVTAAEKASISTAVQPADLAGYVAKSGDTMTGALNMGPQNITFKDLGNNTVTLGYGGQYKGIAVNGDIVLANGKVFSKGSGLTRESGNAIYPWDKTYTKKINNGADIDIPTSGGTMARVEDLPSAEAGTTGYVYTKTASGAEWAAPSGGTTVTIITED